MQGSLIFVVIVAIWAAYLVQHWVRRREDAAATRSVDGFSEAMRVLQKRPLLPRTELSAPRPHSYTVTPARGSRATVDVKRAVSAGSARATSPLSARSGGSAATTGDVRSDSLSHSAEVEPMLEALRPVRDQPESEGPSLGQRRLRAGVLLVSLLWLPVSLALALVGRLMWLSVPFAMLTVAAVVVWLRTEATGERPWAAGESHESAYGAGAPVAFEPGVDDTQVVHSHVYAAQPHRVGATESTEATEVLASVSATAGSAVAFFDGQADEVAAAPAALAAPAAPGTWSPVPVPRPTYSLKVKAEPRLTESGIPADVFATPEFADEADEGDEADERGLFARRAVSE